MTGEIIIRKSVPGDKAAVEQLFETMLKSIYHTDEVQGYEAGYLDKFYAGKGDWICAAEADGRLVGYLSIEEHLETEHFLYLDDCSVAEGYRCRGIGRAFFAEAERYAREKGITRIYLHVEQENTRAIRLYQSLGYEILKAVGSRYRMCLTLDGLRFTAPA